MKSSMEFPRKIKTKFKKKFPYDLGISLLVLYLLLTELCPSKFLTPSGSESDCIWIQSLKRSLNLSEFSPSLM